MVTLGRLSCITARVYAVRPATVICDAHDRIFPNEVEVKFNDLNYNVLLLVPLPLLFYSVASALCKI